MGEKILPRKEILDQYIERTLKSKKAYEEAKELIPGGVGSGYRYIVPYPFFIKEAKGSKFWDLDGNEYIDYLMAYGPLIAGHAHPVIVEAVKEQLEKGSLYAIPHEKTVEFLRELKKRYPMLDMFRLTNSGTESTLHAIRLARAYTGKDKIVKIEGCYHGMHDNVLVSVEPRLGAAGPRWAPSVIPDSLGTTKASLQDVVVAPFNDIEVMERIFQKHEGEIAAVILEAVMMNGVGVIPPVKNYYQDLRKLTDEYNVLIIFDEVKTGARVAYGGAAELYNVKPDIVTLAKAIGGGFSLGAFGARKEIMELVTPLGRFLHGGTYNANPLAITAGVVTLKKIMTKQAYRYLHKLNEEMVKGVNDLIEDTGINASVTSVSPMGYIYFPAMKPKNYREAVSRVNMQKTIDFWFAMLNRGVLIWAPCQMEQWNITMAHTEEDIQYTLEKIDEAFQQVK